MPKDPMRTVVMRDDKTKNLIDSKSRISIPAELRLEVPEDSELSSVELKVRPEAKSERIPCLFSSLDGPIGDAAAIKGKSAAWIVADFKEEVLTCKTTMNISPGEAEKVRLSVFSDNSWTPLRPMNEFDLKGSRDSKHSFSFPDAPASKMMLEFGSKVENTGIWKPSSVSINGVEFYSKKFPFDLSAAVLENRPFFKKDGVRKETDAFELEGLTDEALQYLSETGESGVPLIIRGRTPADVILEAFDAELVFMKKEFGSESGESFRVEPGYEKELAVKIGAGAVVKEISFDYEAEFSTERLIVDFSPKSPFLSNTCDDSHFAAQCFDPLSKDERLAKFDLFARISKLPLTAELSLRPDASGAPDENPFPDSVSKIELVEKKENFWKPGWISFKFYPPPVLDESRWWAVLSAEAGELFWYMDKVEPAGPPMHKTGKSSWKESAQSQSGQAPLGRLSRLFAEGDASPEIYFNIRRGNESASVFHDNSGAVGISGEDLSGVNQSPAEDLKLIVSGNAVSDIKLKNILIRYTQKDKQ